MNDPLINKKILITGANGYIGRHVVETLLNIGIKVIAVDIDFSEFDERAEKIRTDIFTNPSKVFNRLSEVDACLHLAWKNSFNHYSKSHIDNLPLHFNFIEGLIDAGLQRIIVQGSMHEVGYWVGKIDENTPTNPITYYGIGKNALRQATKVLASRKNITFQWIRAFYIIGDDIRNHSVFTKILQAERENKTVFPLTSGENKYDFIS
ncbi:MAG: NAD(P)-dependent oxidoreductase, partial [Bacteroidales bacterium]|nr:NAD(P)-dependent oxidoreductase [Bacteroidales bacterium]